MRLTEEREKEILMYSDILGHPDLMEVLDEVYRLREEMSLLVSFSDKLNEARIKAEEKEKELEVIKAAARRISWNDSVYGYIVSSKEADRLLALIYPNFKKVLKPEYFKEIFEENRLDKIATLFDAIKHGDEKHQQWLKEKIEEHFK